MEYLKKAKARPKEELETRKASVAEIIHNIQVGGDKALLEYNQRLKCRQRLLLKKPQRFILLSECNRS